MIDNQPADDILSQPIQDVETLMAQLSDPDPSLIRQAAVSASWDGYEDPRVVRALLGLLEHADPDVRWSAVLGLGHKVNGEVEAAFINHAMRDPAPHVRAACVSHLYKGGNRSSKALAEAQSDPDPRVRVQVALSQMHSKSRHGIRMLRSLITDPDWDVRLAACKACLHHGVSDEQIVQVMEQLSKDPKTAEHDRQMAEHRTAVRQRLAGSKFLSNIELASRSIPELLAHARDLASRRRGIWRLFSR